MKIGLFITTVVLSADLCAQVSPFNGRPIVPPDSTGAYRLLFGGHFHGSSTNASGYPAATVLASIDAINATGANVLLSTGDLFMDPDRDSARFVASLFRELELPLFNAPGNHDLQGEAFAAGRRMPQVLAMGSDRIVLFDTERDDSRLKGDQLKVLEELADSGAAGRRVFVVSHRPIWSEGDPRYSDLFSGNTRSVLDPGFKTEVLPLVRRIARQGEVFWISGSMAGRARSSIFFQPEERNITYIQCAVRDQLRDALLIADVSPSGVRWKGMSLTGDTLLAVREYDAVWWRTRLGEADEFNWRLLPYLVKKTVLQPAFAYGLVAGVVLMLLVLFCLWRRRK